MARRVTYQLIDDLDQEVIPEGEGETIEFSVAGREYVIDLSADHAREFRADLDKWVSAARSADRRKEQGPPSAEERTAIRAWARERGLKVGSRGQIPREIVDEFRSGA